MNVSKSDLIDLAAFRKANNMSQADVAIFLKTSRSFISSIESGRSRLPEEKLKYIYQMAEHDNSISAWPICPAYSRLRELDIFLKKSGRCESLLKDIVKDNIVVEEAMLSQKEIDDIKMGRISLPLYFIEDVCKKFPVISKRWLQTGDGSINDSDSQTQNCSKEIKLILEAVQHINDEINELRIQVNRLEKKFGY